MKKLILAFLVVISLQSFSQSSQKENKVDSVTTETPLITIGDLNDLISLLSKKMTIEQTQLFQDVNKLLNDKVQLRIKEYYEKQKQLPKK